MKRILLAVVTLTYALGFSTGCAKGKKFNVGRTAASLLISDQQENQLGLQVKQELETKEKIKYLEDPTVVEYVRNLSTRILQQANKDRPGVKWKINVIDDPKTVNAFATPGGYLYVYTGLLLAAENEAEVAGVMGHEAGHVVGRHSAQAMLLQYGEQAVIEAALGKNAGTVSKIAAGLAGNGAALAFSRGNETEADELGARYISAVNYDPHGLATFFQKLAAQEGKTPAVLKWLSTHPASADRVTHINKYIQQNRLTGAELGGNQLAAIKQRLRK
ncbi:peptidase, M48 family [Cystobacter fuscus DSM 2262]|uniref:Peptidase, M48 family n=1 Tax=Cystobacter fuscus (strain ATCC 25194 / DSM 2262 / NBRC 100088 / M29) TaxID=1242864 RepID=S9PR81_CYSF2|nr:M48 family metallopeptidase [Cystobacter fuscus]EPX65027.1 peptidase, M48 family [Cystobacter fuscus DSM 2262]